MSASGEVEATRQVLLLVCACMPSHGLASSQPGSQARWPVPEASPWGQVQAGGPANSLVGEHVIHLKAAGARGRCRGREEGVRKVQGDTGTGNIWPSGPLAQAAQQQMTALGFRVPWLAGRQAGRRFVSLRLTPCLQQWAAASPSPQASSAAGRTRRSLQVKVGQGQAKVREGLCRNFRCD